MNRNASQDLWEGEKKRTFASELIRILVICLAAVLLSLNIRTFVRAGGLFPGGATGLTLLLQRIASRFFDLELPYTVVNLLMNALPIYIGFRFIGKRFTGYSCLFIVLSNILTDLLPGFVVTYDTLLVSVFGGMINGFVISLCLSQNATTGGTDFIAIFLNDRFGIDGFNMVLGLNAVILVAAGLLFGWDKALYSIIFQFVSTQTLHLLYKEHQQVTMFIVTDKPAKVCEVISNLSHHSATILEGEGAYEGETHQMVYSVIGESNYPRISKAVRNVDEKAFINAIKTQHLSGRFYYKPYD